MHNLLEQTKANTTITLTTIKRHFLCYKINVSLVNDFVEIRQDCLLRDDDDHESSLISLLIQIFVDPYKSKYNRYKTLM